MTYKNTIISLITLAGMGLAAWTTFLSFKPHNPTAATTLEVADAYMEGVTAVIMDKQGKPTMKIVTPKLVHFTKNDRTELTTPQLTLYRKSPEPWYITAKYATATQGVDNVLFWQDVMLHHAADENNPATLIKTPVLTVHPNAETAETKALITLIQPSIIVKATGMDANMKTGDIKLLSQAQGEYVPSS